MFGWVGKVLLRLLLTGENYSQRAEEAKNYTECSNEIFAAIAKLIKKAEKHYPPPEKDCKKAYPLFLEIIELARENKIRLNKEATTTEDLQLRQNIEFACWGSFVCTDFLEKFSDQDMSHLISLIESVSPNQAYEIQERLKDYRKQNSLESIENDIISLLECETIDLTALEDKLQLFQSICDEQKAYWALENLGKTLLAFKLSGGFSWRLYTQALSVCKGKKDSIYAAMGHLRKKEKAYKEAANMFLHAYQQNKKDTYLNQLRICLKKTGCKNNTENITENIINLLEKEGLQAALSYIDEQDLSKT